VNLSFLPNLITILRILLVPPVVLALLNEQYLLAIGLFALAGFSDGVDGYLARRYNWSSWWGSVLDPIADKLLQVSTYLTLAWLAHLPWWLVIAVVARDVIIVSGSFTYYAIFRHFEADPTWISKWNTAFQILLVLLVVLNVSMVTIPSLLLQGLMLLVFVTTVISGTQYVTRWIRLAIENSRS
jgi:cardiolipin synthase